MQYTYVSAKYASPSNDTMVVETTDFGAIVVSSVDRPDVWDEVVASGIPVAAYHRVISVSQVKAEAQRRIIALCNVDSFDKCLVKQLNALKRATELVNKKAVGGTLTEAEQSEETQLQGLATAIDLIRAKSNEIEAMSPIPEDFANDSYWA